MFMNIEERKEQLIGWISKTNDESIIEILEDFKTESKEEIPTAIWKILEASHAGKSDAVTHTSARDVLRNK